MDQAGTTDEQTIPWLQLTLGTAIAIGAVALVLSFVDIHLVWRILTNANRELVLAGLAVTAVHYAAVGFRFAAFLELFEVPVPVGVMVRIGIVSSAINRAVGFAGMVVHSLRVGAIKLWGGQARDVVGAAIVNQAFQVLLNPLLFLLGLLLVFGVPAEVVYLFDPRALLSASGVAFLASVLVIGLLATRVGGWASHGAERLMRWIQAGNLGTGAQGLHEVIDQRIGEIREDPSLLTRPGIYMVIEPVASLTVLAIAFWAIGNPLGPGPIVLAYATANLSSIIGIVPGGLGIKDGSMAGILAWVGVPWESALAGVLLFRAMLDWAPSILLLPLGWGLVGGAPSTGSGHTDTKV